MPRNENWKVYEFCSRIWKEHKLIKCVVFMSAKTIKMNWIP
ncbi:hypothetical protein ACU8KH_04463 [Lachancea thermotolerans]